MSSLVTSKHDDVVRKAANRVLPGFEFESQSTWQGPFYFVQAADTQLGLTENFVDGSYADKYPDVNWDVEIELCRQSVRALNAMNPKPAFFIVCGDLVDAFPERWPEIRKQQESDLLEVYSELDKEIPMVCVCGNHDVGNKPTHETVERYKKTFGDDSFSFWFGGVHFIVLNSQLYEDCSLTQDLADSQESWLTSELSNKTNFKHRMVFQHIPWFLREPDEEKNYFNIEINLRKKMLEKFYDGGVRKIFCGHYHSNAGGFFKNDLELVVTSAIGFQLGTDPHGMRIVKVKENQIDHEYLALDRCPKNISLD